MVSSALEDERLPVADGPLITVVVPCLNRASYVQSTVDSILAQAYSPIECIVVDGASTDGTQEILRSYGERIRWLSEPDSGPFEAVAKGWAMGAGEILAWLNADDTWAPGAALAAVRAFVADPAAALVYGAATGTDERNGDRYQFPARSFDLRKALVGCDQVIMQAASFVRRRSVEAVGGIQPSWAYDQELWLRIGLAGGCFVPIAEVLADIRISDTDAHLDPALMVPARLAMMGRLFALPGLDPGLRRLRRRALSNTHLSVISDLRLRTPSHWVWGPRCLWRALLSDPTNAGVVARHLIRLVRARVRRQYRFRAR